MADRAELLEATVDCVPEGVAVFDEACQVAFWNQAAQAITGYAPQDLLGRAVPESLRSLLESGEIHPGAEMRAGAETRHGALLQLGHKFGHQVPVMGRSLMLRDGLGQRMGSAILFHPAECLDALPHGITGDSEEVMTSQADLMDRLDSLFEDFNQGGAAFGVLWIAVDQAGDLRKTHGAGACEAMLRKVEKVLAQGLRPAEYLGRWGEDEYLVLSHERTGAMLSDHAQVLAGLARTADFRWWGDRISLTVSIGAAHAERSAALAELLEKAKAAMLSSYHAGGNRISTAMGVK